MAGVDFNRGAKRAREARAALGLDPTEPVPCLLTLVEERVEVPVVIARLHDDVAGACWRNGAGTVLWVNGCQGLPRRRFTLAHEVGHVWCEHDGAATVDSFATLSGRTSNPYEVQANAFAAEFLLPKQAALARFAGGPEPGLQELVRLAGGYGVSAIVALIRLETANLVSARRAKRLRAEIDADHHRELEDDPEIAWIDDRLATITEEQLPYLSEALDGSALHAALAGDTTVTAAARAANVDEASLAPALAAIS